jgi:hypothetical protein
VAPQHQGAFSNSRPNASAYGACELPSQTAAHLPGDVDVTIECWPGSSLPDELLARRHDLTATGNSERILVTAITERFCMGAGGELEPLTPVSTRPVASTGTHAGICRMKRYAFDAP